MLIRKKDTSNLDSGERNYLIFQGAGSQAPAGIGIRHSIWDSPELTVWRSPEVPKDPCIWATPGCSLPSTKQTSLTKKLGGKESGNVAAAAWKNLQVCPRLNVLLNSHKTSWQELGGPNSQSFLLQWPWGSFWTWSPFASWKCDSWLERPASVCCSPEHTCSLSWTISAYEKVKQENTCAGLCRKQVSFIWRIS